jgi:hypothetical protein
MNEKNGQENGADQNISTEGIQHPNGVPATGEVKARRTWPFEAKALMVGLIVVGVYLAVSAISQSGNEAGEEVRANAVPPVVVLDLYGLQQAKLQQVQADGLPFETVAREGEAFARRLDAVLSDYRDAGMVVLNRNAVIAAPTTVDVTEVIATRLGVKYSPPVERGAMDHGAAQ